MERLFKSVLNEVAVCDSDVEEGHGGSVVVMLSSILHLPVENRGGSDQAEGGVAYDVQENCFGSVKVTSPGNAAGQWCRRQEWYPSRWLAPHGFRQKPKTMKTSH